MECFLDKGARPPPRKPSLASIAGGCRPYEASGLRPGNRRGAPSATRSVDLFIQSDKTLEEVAAVLKTATGKDLIEGDAPETLQWADDGVTADLRKHPYIDDGELSFEEYTYALSARASGYRLTETPEAIALRRVADKLRGANVRTLLVHDLQYRDRPPAPRPSTDTDTDTDNDTASPAAS